MLLDVENYYGEHNGRLAPLLIFLALAGLPVIGWVYVGFFIPLWLFLPLWTVYAIRVLMLTIGKEGERLAQFKRQLYDEYSSVYDLLQIRTIHKDGCIEYAGEKVAYMVVLENGTCTDPIAQSRGTAEFISLVAAGGYDFDVLIQNLNDASTLERRYSSVKFFTTPEAAKDFTDIIDFNRSHVQANSMLNRVVLVVKTRKPNWKTLRLDLDSAVQSASARVFKSAAVADAETVSDIINRDINGTIDIEDLLCRKYAAREYRGSKALYYGVRPPSEAPKPDTLGFMASTD
jgi:hypothetical protein